MGNAPHGGLDRCFLGRTSAEYFLEKKIKMVGFDAWPMLVEGLKKGDLDKALLAAVEKLKKGEVSGWSEGRAGWYLLKLEDKKDSRLKTFEESRKSIEERIYSQKQAVELEKFMVELKKKSYIKIIKPEPIKG